MVPRGPQVRVVEVPTAAEQILRGLALLLRHRGEAVELVEVARRTVRAELLYQARTNVRVGGDNDDRLRPSNTRHCHLSSVAAFLLLPASLTCRVAARSPAPSLRGAPRSVH